MPWKSLLKPPPRSLWFDLVLWSLVFVWMGWRCLATGFLLESGWPAIELVLAFAAAVMVVGYWLCQWWVRWYAIGMFAVIGISMAALSFAAGRFSLGRSAVVAGCVYAIWLAWQEKIPPRDGDFNESDDDEQPLLSLVLLLREPMYLEASVVARIASQAWDANITATSDDEDEGPEPERDGFVVGNDVLYMVMYGPGMFIVHNRHNTYFDNPQAVIEECRELRSRAAIAEHQAWVAMDLLRLSSDDPAIEREAYRLIGRFLAELADKSQCLAVLDPASGGLHPFDPETEQKLRSDDPVGALREWFYSPIVSVSDAALADAVAEARSRWPEFVSAFETRDPDGTLPFMIKAPFGSGDNIEFMWVEVTALEGETIYGVLKNHPRDIPALHEGDRVSVSVADLNDWLCVVNEQTVGGFTMKAISESVKKPKEEE